MTRFPALEGKEVVSVLEKHGFFVDPKTPVKIDAYSFYTGLKYGYMAFRFNPNSGMWFIKSFKPNRDPDPRNLALAAQLGNFKLHI